MKLRYPNKITIVGNNSTTIQNEAVLDCCLSNDVLTLKITSDITPICFIKLLWKLSETEKRGKSTVKVLGDAWERGYGDLEWQRINQDRNMPWYFAVSNGSDSVKDTEGRFTECFGVKVRPTAFCQWNYSDDEITLTLDIRNGGTGVILNGRTLNVAEIIFNDYIDVSAYDAISRFCKEMCMSVQLPTSPVFGFNDWYFSYGSSNGELILNSAKMLTLQSEKYASVPYMVIDDGWQINFNDGPWHLFNPEFEDMSVMASKISSLGALPGIWIRPLQQKAAEATIPNSWRMSFNTEALDPSNPEVINYIKDCIKRIVDWGFKLIKYDFVTYDIFLKWGFECDSFLADDGWSFYDTSKTTAEIIIELYTAIREAAGDTVLIGCNAVSHLCAGLVELNRTGDDTSGKEWARTLKMGVNTLAFRSPQNKAFYMADADCAGITNNIPFHLNQKWLYALAVSGSPMFVSISPNTVDENIIGDVYQALIRNSVQKDNLVPLDWMETKTPSRWLLNGDEIYIDWNN